jgi:hypothetical protein
MAMPGSCAEGPLLVEKPVDGLKSMRRQRGLQFPTVGNFLWLGLRWEQPPRSTWNKLLDGFLAGQCSTWNTVRLQSYSRRATQRTDSSAPGNAMASPT